MAIDHFQDTLTGLKQAKQGFLDIYQSEHPILQNLAEKWAKEIDKAICHTSQIERLVNDKKFEVLAKSLKSYKV